MKQISDQQLENSVGNMLRFGVTVSALVVTAGGALYLIHAPRAVPDYTHFQMEADHLRDPLTVLAGAMHLDAMSVIQLGILLLIATPVVRVLYCVVGFARQNDKLYVSISALVLLILTYSLWRGGR